ncbi:MAG: ATP-binding protein [Pseudomonadota bacterium]|nr:ATP-binding protein [Pseudomonadota bacterium]
MSSRQFRNQPFIRIRRRDTAAVASLGGTVVALLWLFGELAFVQAFVAIATIAALSVIYYLTVSTSLNPATLAAAEERASDAVVPAPASDETSLTAHALLSSLPVPVLLIASSGKVEDANPAAREFLGLGNEAGHLSSVLRQPQVLEAVSLALRGETVDPVEYSNMAPVESHVRAFIAPLGGGGVAAAERRAMLVLTDETSIKRADRMRADFLANASHELRTPLASLAGFIETLMGHAKNDPEARDRFLSIMFDQTERMQRLINDLLSLSRVEMDEHVPPVTTIDPHSIVEDVVSFLRPQIEKKGIEVQQVLGAKATVIGDRDQITEVVQNLVENAIKYAGADASICVSVAGPVARDDAERPALILGETASRLTLAAPAQEVDAQFVTIRVQDSGKGIERRDLPRLSERFFRVDGQKSGPKEGTGLGLAIVKHIVNRHRGGFTVESAPEIGSVFSIFLPASERPRGAADETAD